MSKSHRKSIVGLVAVLGFAFVAPSVEAKELNINFFHGGTGGSLGPADMAGVVSSANWNNVDGSGAVSGLGGLVLNDGSATGITVSSHHSGPNGAEPVGGATPSDVMMSGGVRSSIIGHGNDPSVGQIMLTGLAADFTGTYDLYVYLGEGHPNMGSSGNIVQSTNAGDFTSGNGGDVPAGTAFPYVTVLNDGTSYPPFELTGAGTPGNYALLSGLSGDTQVLSFQTQGGNNDGAGGFFNTLTTLGLQVVAPDDTGGGAVVPEPGTLGLFGVVGGVAAFYYLRRRRRR